MNEIEQLKAELAAMTAERDRLAQQLWGVATKTIGIREAATQEAARRLSRVQDEFVMAGVQAAERIEYEILKSAKESVIPSFGRHVTTGMSHPNGDAKVSVRFFEMPSHHTLTMEMHVRSMAVSVQIGRHAARVLYGLTKG